MKSSGARKVLHLINGEFYAGAERVQDLLALRLGEFGFDVEFACLKDGIFAAQRQARDVPLHEAAMKSRADIRLYTRLARLVRTGNVKLIHTHTPRTALLGSLVAGRTGVPMVHHVHSPTGNDTENGLRNVRNSLVERMSVRGARRLIAVSGSLEQELIARGYDTTRVRRVANGVPVGECLRPPFQVGESLTLGMVALFRPRKGVEVLLDAMGQLTAAGVDVRLHAVGPFESAAYESSVRQKVADLGLTERVEWTGFRSDIAAEFRRMHVFVLPSLFGEGMPMVVLEAMAAGLPVVSTRVEGIPEVVRDGQDGLVVEAADASALALAIRRFADGDASTSAMGDSGWHRQRERYSDSAMAGRVAGIYEEVLRS
jgi:glycosyltransferase involved in cell wall biosynthesis